jgi:hypothetical protein
MSLPSSGTKAKTSKKSVKRRQQTELTIHPEDGGELFSQNVG